MSGYADVEALWLARVRAVSGFDANNTSRGDWGILNNGEAAFYAILKPGEHTHEMIAFKTKQHNYQTVIELWQKYRDDGPSLEELEANYNTLLAALDEYPRLGDTGGTIQKGEIVTSAEVVQVPPDAPSWMMAQMIGLANEEIEINFQE